MKPDATVVRTIAELETDVFLDLIAPTNAVVRLLDTYDETSKGCNPLDVMIVVKTSLQQLVRRAEDIGETASDLQKLYVLTCKDDDIEASEV